MFLPPLVLEHVSVWFVLLTAFSVILAILTLWLLVRARRVAGFMAEKSLSEILASRELFYTLYRNSPVPYVLLLGHGEMSLMNEAAVRLFGSTQEELQGKLLFDLFDSEDEKEKVHLNVLPSLFRRGSPVSNEEYRLLRPDGQIRWVLFSLFPVNTEGNPHKGLAALVDITRQKEVDRAKTEFLSLASHQLRTPIASLKWNIELLRSPKTGILTETQETLARTLSRGIERVNALIDDFLSISRLELGNLKVEKTRIATQEFLQDALKDIQKMANDKTIDITLDVDIPIISSDPRLLRHITANLVSNAVKYTPRGGHVRARAYESQNDLVFEVSDTGMGIPLEEQGHVFTKFFRATNAQKDVAEGTGLGLYIVELSTLALGGTISFASKPGLGTAFTVRLPQE